MNGPSALPPEEPPKARRVSAAISSICDGVIPFSVCMGRREPKRILFDDVHWVFWG
jgi:hypothetical protein